MLTMKLASLRAVFLDAGNTILGMDYVLLAEVAGRAGLRVRPEEVWRAEAAARVRLDALLATGRSTETVDTFRRYCDLILEGIQVPEGSVRDALRERVAAAEVRERLWSVAMPGVVAAMARIKALGLKLGIVSNADGRVAERLRHAGLDQHLDYIGDSRLIGSEKPDPGIFQHVAAHLGVRPDQALHVGDLHAIDVVGAQRAGIPAVLLDPFDLWGERGCPKARDLTQVVDQFLTGA